MAVKHSRRHLKPVAAAVAFALVGGYASADVLEEVVVTAQKRSENLQNVPIAISAFTADTLQSKGLNDITRLSSLTPNVNLDGGAPFSGDSSVLSASIRGVGQDDFAFNLDPGVGVYLDGVYLARTIGANQSLMDVDRIEILKGPQGTLFGRNTIGGAINVVTHTPGTEPKITAQMTVGQFNRHDASITADMPISSNILTTLSVSSQTQDGWQHVVPYPTYITVVPYQVTETSAYPTSPGTHSSDAGGGKNQQALRGKILIHATDTLDVTISGDWTHENQGGLANTVLSVNNTGPNGPFNGWYSTCITTPASALGTTANSGFYNTVNGMCGPLGVGTWNSTTNSFRGNGFTGGSAATGGAGALGVPNSVLQGILTANGITSPVLGHTYTLASYGNAAVTLGNNPLSAGSILFPGKTPRLYWSMITANTGNIDSTYSDGMSFAKFNAYGGSVTFDWNLADNMKFKSITGWREILWNVGTDLDGTPDSFQAVSDEQRQRQVSQEFQLTGKAFNDRLDYAGGLYYFTESGYVHDFVPFNTGYLYVYDYNNDVRTKSYAAYLHADYKLTDDWGLTLGGRYSKEKKSFLGGQGDLDGLSYKASGCYDPSAIANTYAAFAAVPNGVTCQQVLGFADPNNPLRYFPNQWDNQTWNVFTPTFGTQYHIDKDVMLYASYSKGFKSGGWTTRLSNPISDPSKARFSPEYDKTIELGVKSQWFDRHLQANLAVFQSKYDGIQLNVQEGPSPVYQNAGDAKIKGVELELQSVFDNGFAVTLNGGYIDAYYTYLNPCLLYNTDSSGNCVASAGSSYSPIWGGFTYHNELPKTPKYKVALSPSYDAHLPNGWTLRTLADYTYTAHLYNDSLNTPLLERPSTHVLNASIHLLPENGKYDFAVGATNLTNDRYLTVGSTNSAAGEVVGSYNAPRMWYVSVKAKIQ